MDAQHGAKVVQLKNWRLGRFRGNAELFAAGVGFEIPACQRLKLELAQLGDSTGLAPVAEVALIDAHSIGGGDLGPVVSKDVVVCHGHDYGAPHTCRPINLHYRWHKVGAVDTIGGRIRTTRKALGLNQTELAKLVGLDQSTISDIENGALFGADVLMALAAALLKSPQFIMTGAAPICTTAALRSPAIRAEFQRLNPCPANGNKRGACPGWEREHTTPLCAGGADAVENMTWMRVEHHKAKTKQDMAACRAYRRAMTMGAAAP